MATILDFCQKGYNVIEIAYTEPREYQGLY